MEKQNKNAVGKQHSHTFPRESVSCMRRTEQSARERSHSVSERLAHQPAVPEGSELVRVHKLRVGYEKGIQASVRLSCLLSSAE